MILTGRGGRSVPEPTCRAAARRSRPGHQCEAAGRLRRTGPGRRGARDDAPVRVHQAGHHRRQRRRGRHGRDDAARHRHPARRRVGAVRIRVRPSRHRARRGVRHGSCPESSASLRRPSGSTPAASSTLPRRWPAGWCAASTLTTSSSTSPARLAAGDRRRALRFRSRSLAACCGGDSSPITRCTPTASIHARCSPHGQACPTRGRRDVVPREASGPVHRPSERRPSRHLPRLGRPGVLLTRNGKCLAPSVTRCRAGRRRGR